MMQTQDLYCGTPKLDSFNNFLPPKYYLDNNRKRHRFNHLETTVKEVFQNILQYISPDADLNATPTMSIIKFYRIKITILNYTKTDLSSFKNRHLSVLGKDIATFTDEDSHIVAYNTFEHQEIVCMDQKNDHTPLLEERYFVDVNSLFSEFLAKAFFLYPPKKNYTIFNQIHTQVFDVALFIKNDDCMRYLIDKIDKKAVLIENPTLVQFGPRNGLPIFTILNHTDNFINIDIIGDLFINGDFISNLKDSKSENCHLIIYHLIDHPELICIERGYETKSDSDLRIYVKHAYKKNSNPESFIKIHPELNVSGTTGSFLENIHKKINYKNESKILPNGIYSNKIAPPKFCKNSKGEIKKFDKIKSKTIFENLLQHTSPDANINSTPTLKHFSLC